MDFLKQLGDTPPRQTASLLARGLWLRVGSSIDTKRARCLLWRYGAEVGDNLSVSGRIRCNARGKLVIGNNVRLNSGPNRNFVGGDRRINIWVGQGARVEIRDGAGISNSTIVARTSIVIMEGALVGGGTDIYDNDFHERLPADRAARTGGVESSPVIIGPGAFVGAWSIILKGVTVGAGAIIGAGSLVAKSVPPHEIWAGRPARFVGRVDSK